MFTGCTIWILTHGQRFIRSLPLLPDFSRLAAVSPEVGFHTATDGQLIAGAQAAGASQLALAMLRPGGMARTRRKGGGTGSIEL